MKYKDSINRKQDGGVSEGGWAKEESGFRYGDLKEYPAAAGKWKELKLDEKIFCEGTI